MLEISKDANKSTEYTSAPNAAPPPAIQQEVIFCADEQQLSKDISRQQRLEDTITGIETELSETNQGPEAEEVKLIFEGKGEFSVKGAGAIPLGVTVIGMLVPLVLVLSFSRPVSDAYTPMLLMGTGSLGSSYMNSRRKKS